MKSLLFLVIIGSGFFLNGPLLAQSNPAVPRRPFAPNYTISGLAKLPSGSSYRFHIYGSGDVVRSDLAGEGRHAGLYPQIFHLSDGQVYTLVPKDKTAVTSRFQPESIQDNRPAILVAAADFEFIDTESVNGRNCLKYKGLTDDGGVVFYTWTDAKTHVPIRSMSENGDITITWYGYRPGPQKAALFAIPSHWKTMRWGEYIASKTPPQ